MIQRGYELHPDAQEVIVATGEPIRAAAHLLAIQNDLLRRLITLLEEQRPRRAMPAVAVTSTPRTNRGRKPKAG